MTTFADAFLAHEAYRRATVIADTWGHLAPKKNKTYRGHIIFTLGCFDHGYLNPTPIVCEFKNLSSSPWFYEVIHTFLQDMVEPLKLEEGKIYRWDGTFKNYEFDGITRQCTIS